MQIFVNDQSPAFMAGASVAHMVRNPLSLGDDGMVKTRLRVQTSICLINVWHECDQLKDKYII